MALTEQFANTASSTLVNTISPVALSLQVASAAPFPGLPQFRLLIDSEIVLVTAVSGVIYTVARGQEGTAAASHLAGAAVTHVLTAGSLAAAVGDPNNPWPGTAGGLAAGQGLLLTTGWQENLNNGNECRLRLFCSANMGKQWNVLAPDYVYKDPQDNGVYFAPANGQLRDATFLHYGDKYYTAYTNDYGGTKQQFSIASATDLLTWSWVTDYTVPASFNAFRVRAPEFFVDSDNTVHIFFSFSTGASQTNDQMYEIHTTDSPPSFTAWSNPVAVGYAAEPSFCIDPFVLKYPFNSTGTYYLFYKNANTNQCELASSSGLTTGYTLLNNAVTPNTVNQEGYSVVQLDGVPKFRLFTDRRTDQGYYYSDSADLFHTWSTLTAVSSPYVWQHGTVVRVLDLALWRHMTAAAMAQQHAYGSRMTLINNVAITNNAWTAVTFSATDVDELGAFQAGNPTRLTAPSSGWYQCFGHTAWDSNTTGQRLVALRLNGNQFAVQGNTPTAAAPGVDLAVSAPFFFQVGDYLELYVYQNSGGTINAQGCQLTMLRSGGY